MFKIIRFNSLPSTNLYIKENYKKLDNYTVVVTNHQTAGRGRMDRVWVDSDDLLFSILIKDDMPNRPQLSLLVSSSLCKTLAEYGDVTIKWPNDILINNKKVSGILLEGVYTNIWECVVIGIGINANSTNFPSDLKTNPTSLKLLINKDINKEKLLNSFLEVFAKDYHDFLNDCCDYIVVHRKYSALIGKMITVNDVYGKVLDINDDGMIILQTESERLLVNSGEITLHGNYQ